MATSLETTTEWLLHGDEFSAEDKIHQPEVEAKSLSKTTPLQVAATVPVLGTALGAVVGDGFVGTMIDAPVEYVPAPPAMTTASGLYAIFVAGESMTPAHNPGDLRFVSKHRPCRPGDTVVVHTRNHDGDPGQHYIKRLVDRDSDSLTLAQLNPAATLHIDSRFVVSMHRVLTVNEMFGA